MVDCFFLFGGGIRKSDFFVFFHERLNEIVVLAAFDDDCVKISVFQIYRKLSRALKEVYRVDVRQFVAIANDAEPKSKVGIGNRIFGADEHRNYQRAQKNAGKQHDNEANPIDDAYDTACNKAVDRDADARTA